MNIYFLTRWGNGEDEYGPDSFTETNMIVRARELDLASDMADRYLTRLPLKTNDGREVATFFQNAVLLGVSENKEEKEGVVCNLWYGKALPQNCLKAWRRDSISEGWISHEEYFGE